VGEELGHLDLCPEIGEETAGVGAADAPGQFDDVQIADRLPDRGLPFREWVRVVRCARSLTC
jgi:hypothetical protein